MKFLLVSDLHYALKQYDWTAAAGGDFDAVVIAGDHLDIAGQLDGGVQVVVILKYLKRLKTRTNVIVSSGNHDLDRRDASGEKIASWMNRVRGLGIATDGDSIAYGDTLVTICQWWDGPGAKETVRAQIERDSVAAANKTWMWVYHAPPEGSPTSWNGKQFYGDADLSGWIEQYQPHIVFCGHIHQAPFRAGGSWVDRIGQTWVFNSGRQIGDVPAHVVVDTQAREAAWFSMAGAELVRLDFPLERPVASIEEMPAWMTPTSYPDRDPSRA